MTTKDTTRTRGRTSTQIKWNQVQDTYTVWEDLGNTDRARTLSELRKVFERLVAYPWFAEPYYRTNADGKPHQSRRQYKQRVSKWLRHPETYYPFEDEVLVARALDFHHDAWDKLTVREWVVVMNRLAEMPDPWETQTGPWSGFGGLDMTWEEAILPNLSARMYRLRTEFTFRERKTLMGNIEARKRRKAAHV